MKGNIITYETKDRYHANTLTTELLGVLNITHIKGTTYSYYKKGEFHNMLFNKIGRGVIFVETEYKPNIKLFEKHTNKYNFMEADVKINCKTGYEYWLEKAIEKGVELNERRKHAKSNTVGYSE